jgi:hypothetical protein
MSLPKRNGFRWSVNEILSLQREYELLNLSISEIAEKHQRTPEAIMYKLDNEGFADFNVLYSNFYDLDSSNHIDKGENLKLKYDDDDEEEEDSISDSDSDYSYDSYDSYYDNEEDNEYENEYDDNLNKRLDNIELRLCEFKNILVELKKSLEQFKNMNISTSHLHYDL